MASEMFTLMGIKRAAVPKLLMKLVITQLSSRITAKSSSGEALDPNRLITVSATALPAPVLARALARARVPPYTNRVWRSMDW